MITYNGVEYTPDENGKLEVTFENTSPIEFSIKNTTDEKKDITFNYNTYLG